MIVSIELILFRITIMKMKGNQTTANMFQNYFLFKFLNIKLLLLKFFHELLNFNNADIISVRSVFDDITEALGKTTE